MTAMSKTRQPGWWYPYIFVGAFVVVIGVNATLAYFATSTFTGLSTTDAYEKGRTYNRALAKARAQDSLGWTVDTKAEPIQAASGKPSYRLTITYADHDGKPVEGLKVSAKVIRPTTDGYDHEITLNTLGVGVYGGEYELPLKGVWDLDIVALGPDVSYEHGQRIVVP